MLAYIVRLLVLALCVFGWAPVAHAWTEAQVISAAGRLDVTDPARAQVQLDIGLRVTAGWLSSFELADLDEDLAPASDEPFAFVGPDGRTYPAVITQVKPGTVLFDFGNRRLAPRRGQYTLRFKYTIQHWQRSEQVEPESSTDRIASWSLPRFSTRLSNVSVLVVAPAGTRVVQPLSGDEVSIASRQHAVELSFRRVELPRTQSLSVHFKLPEAEASVARGPALPLYWPNLHAIGLGLGLALAWFIKRRATTAMCALRGLQAHALLRVSHPRLRDAASALLCAGAVPLFEQQPFLAAIGGMLGIGLGIDISFERNPDGVSTPATAPSLAARSAGWLDVTTPVGACVCLASYALLALELRHAPSAVSCSAWLLAPLFFTATRAAPLTGCAAAQFFRSHRLRSN
jgi:hypothetical protein